MTAASSTRSRAVTTRSPPGTPGACATSPRGSPASVASRACPSSAMRSRRPAATMTCYSRTATRAARTRTAAGRSTGSLLGELALGVDHDLEAAHDHALAVERHVGTRLHARILHHLLV